MRGILVILLFSVVNVWSQDPQFSQFYAAPTYLNPGFVGTAVQHRFITNYRHQWPGIPGAFVSYNVSYDSNFEELNSGLGLKISHDKAGSGGLSFTKIAGQYAYEIKLNRHTFIRPGIEYGFVSRYVDKDRLTFGDQLVRGGNFATFEFVDDQRTSYFDLSSGVVLYTPRIWASVSVFHMNRPNESVLGNESIVPIKYGAQFGLRIPLRDFVGQKTNNYIVPAIHYKAQGKYDQVDIGFYFERNPMTIGLWYRGIPGLKAYQPGYRNDDALIVLMGVRAKKVKIGYSYDITISPLISQTLGSHEISVIYEFASMETTLSRTSRKIACPKF